MTNCTSCGAENREGARFCDAVEELEPLELYRCQFASMAAAAERALDCAREIPDRRLETETLGGLAAAWFYGPLTVEGALGKFAETLALDDVVPWRRGFRGELLHLDEAAEHWASVAGEIGASDDIATQMLRRQAVARIRARTGSTDEAELLTREAVALARGTDMLNEHGDALLDLAEVLEAGGSFAEATQHVDEALSSSAKGTS